MDGIANAFGKLHRRVHESTYRGYEFDDILGSPVVRLLTGGNLFLQRIAIQVGRRSVINFRPILGVKKLESSKAYGFFAKGYLYYYLATGAEEYLHIARSHLKWLQENYCKEYSGMSWGNAFDFASRGGHMPRGLPTIVWTSHISESFDLAYDVTKADEYRQVVMEIGRFIKDNIQFGEYDTGICLGYTPGAVSEIHNSSLLGAVALLRAWRHGGDSSYLQLARKAVAWSSSRMNADGSWFYGEGSAYRWIDNFHTAYNLDCLVAAQDFGGPNIVDQGVIDRTYRYWVRHFFLSDGRPRYYHDSDYPTDIQCAAQAVETLSKYSVRDPEALDLALRVATWTIDNMQKRNGAFRFRKGRVLSNGLESIHWGQSTMLSAIGCLVYHLHRASARSAI